MPYYGSQSNDEFGAGVNHLANSGKANDNSVTLGGSLQADSADGQSKAGQMVNPGTTVSVISTAAETYDIAFAG